ncbi:MAG: M15 family metallopeptidase, partial [Polyangiales bacterium]
MFPRAALLLAAVAIVSCSAEGPPEDPGPVGRTYSALTVDQEIAKGGCTSSVVQGLSDQILEELTKCVEPGFLVKVPSGGNLVNNANHPFLEKPAADGLKAALAAKPGSTLTVNSMYRTVAQQYVLWRQASCFPAVADPGRSNHETGLAFDTNDRTTWQTPLEAHGFKW